MIFDSDEVDNSSGSIIFNLMFNSFYNIASVKLRIKCTIQIRWLNMLALLALEANLSTYDLFSAFSSRTMAKTDNQSALDYINQMFPTGHIT